MNYEELLQRAQKSSPKTDDSDRFTLPTVELMTQGTKTVIKNFSNVASTLRREEDHIFKFFLKALAVPGDLKSGRASFTGSFTQRQMDNRIREYARLYVFCYSCGKPDTQLMRENRILFLKCMACGARHPVMAKI